MVSGSFTTGKIENRHPSINQLLGRMFLAMAARHGISIGPGRVGTSSAGFAQVVVDRLGNEIADSAVGLGAILLDEGKLVREEKDRRTHQVDAGGLGPPSTRDPRILGGAWRFQSGMCF
jgi:hypothetical protein